MDRPPLIGTFSGVCGAARVSGPPRRRAARQAVSASAGTLPPPSSRAQHAPGRVKRTLPAISLAVPDGARTASSGSPQLTGAATSHGGVARSPPTGRASRADPGRCRRSVRQPHRRDPGS